ncbi:MAG: DUF721 domain-containing protein [Syntrophobacterales bacterium]|nr:MAG: DUF721 domain-containing protein [Syntrophobacterales bacterium]
MKAKARRNPQRVGAVLEKTLKKMSLEGKLKEHEIWNVWNNVVGEHVFHHAQPEHMRNKILFVKVSSSAWMQQLYYMSKEIVVALNKRLGAHVIEEIRFKLGEIDFRRESPPPPSRSSNPIPSPSKGISKEIQKTLSPIKDVQIKEILGRVMLMALGRREEKAR